MTAETRVRATHDVAEATGGHDTTSSVLLLDELRDVTHRAVLQTPTDTLLTAQQQARAPLHTFYNNNTVFI